MNTGHRRVSRLLVAMVLVPGLVAPMPAVAAPASVPATVADQVPAAVPATDWAGLVPTAESLRQVRSTLPDDETVAIDQLVEIIWGADSLAAVSAAGEILRRAGLPLVSADGPVIALPDGGVIINAPILVEFLPTLTAAARAGTMYRIDQVAELLQFVGFAAEPPPSRDVVALLAAWGKSQDDIGEVRAAGAAVRAIAHRRGELLIPGTVPTSAEALALAEDPGSLPGRAVHRYTADGAVTGIDPIGAVLLLAHAAGEFATGVGIVPAAQGWRGTAAGVLPSAAGGATCDSLIDESATRAGQEYESGVKEYTKQQTRDALGDAAERYGGAAARKWTDRGGEAYDKLTDAISMVLLVLGAKLELSADKGETHFRHQPGERAQDMTLTATASFSSVLAKRHLRCWALVGIDVPPDGPLSGYKINWRMSKAPAAFQAATESRGEFAKGSITGNDGASTVLVYPRTELEPPRDGETQPELTINARVEAGLDKDDFPWKFSDLIDMATSGGVAPAVVKALYNLLSSLLKRGALPTMTLTIPVKYHGQMPFVMKGDMHAAATFVQISLDFRVDLFSCAGPLGPWQGLAGAGGDVAIRHTGDAPEVVGAGQADFPLRFQLAETGQPQRFLIEAATGIQVDLDPDAVRKVLNPATVADMYDGMRGIPVVVGTGTWTIDGNEVARHLGATGAMTWEPGSERFDIVSNKTDERCGGSSYWEGSRFDRTERG